MKAFIVKAFIVWQVLAKIGKCRSYFIFFLSAGSGFVDGSGGSVDFIDGR
jgi:hypothetical protein